MKADPDSKTGTVPVRYCVTVVLIRMCRIRMFLSLLDPDSDLLVIGPDPAPDPNLSIIKQK